MAEHSSILAMRTPRTVYKGNIRHYVPFNKAVLLQANNLNLFKPLALSTHIQGTQGTEKHIRRHYENITSKIQDKETASSINTIPRGKKGGRTQDIDAKLRCEHISVSGSHLKSGFK